ncbi:MAG: fibronectin type III domain-containing protein [Saprospiraceae bacterium]|nr:fibronectin type III domain-containing protein [Saprospiraceae bacterium]
MKVFSMWVLLTLFFVSNLSAQDRHCGTMDVLDRQVKENPIIQKNMDEIERQTEEYLRKHPNGSGQRAVITIPVVVHVVWNSSVPAQNISDAQIQSQIDVLNLDFSATNADLNLVPALFQPVIGNVEVQFCLAQQDPSGNATTGITRKSSTVTSWGTNDNVKKLSAGGVNPWNASNYLNLWVCNIGGGILGYAQFPGGSAATDGVVCDYRYFGTTGTATAPYHKGRTATHEVGHWLNLRHIWGDANCGSDLVADTPTHNTSNGGCPTYPHLSTCSGTPVEMTMNYMDYSYDACMQMFSAGQKARIRAVLEGSGSRASLASSPGCMPPSGGSTCNAPSGLSTGSITTTSAISNWSAVSGAVSYTYEYKASSASTWNAQTVASTSVSLSGLTASTTYNTRVLANCASGSSAYVAVDFTTTSEPTACNAPTGLTAGTITTSSAAITWGAVSGALNYNFEYKTSSASTWSAQVITGTAVNFTGLAASTTYNIRISTNCSGGTSVFSTVLNFTTLAATCNAPTGLATSSITQTTATSSWAAVSGATGYTFEYKTSAASTWTVQTVSGTSVNLTGLAASTTYNTRVKTNCSSASSAYSNTVNFTTTAACADNYESNNSASAAKNITIGTALNAKIGTSTDVDWFKFKNTNAKKNIKVNLNNLPADYDMVLYRGTSTQVGISENDGTLSEQIVYNNTLSATTYYVKVYGYGGVFNNSSCYSLLVQTSGSNYRIDTDANDLETIQVSDELLVFPNPATDEITLVVPFGKYAEGILSVYDITGKVVSAQKMNGDRTLKTFTMDVSQFKAGLYMINFTSGDKSYTEKLAITDRR